MMKPVTAAIAAALISGVAMYVVGARTANVDAFTRNAAQTLNGPQPAPAAGYVQPAGYVTEPAPVVMRRVVSQRAVYRAPAPTSERIVAERPHRSWTKTAMVIGGGTAGGAGLGGIVGGKKGALIGAALGGGAASIYEATQR